jgi:hypothetical protein
MFKFMKAFAVGILAMVALTGCGVGADESYDGVTLVAANGQALEQGSSVPKMPTDNLPQVPINTAPLPIRDPGSVALPQDPIPVYEGKPSPQPPPYLSESVKRAMR